jgi:predicted MFS family arabinose efflux permease
MGMMSPGSLRLVLAVGAFAVGIDAVIVSGLLPGIKSSFGLSSGAAGQLITVFGLGYAVLAPTLGPAVSARSRRLALAGGLLVFALANGLAALAPGYALLLAARVLASAGAAMYTPAALAQARELADRGVAAGPWPSCCPGRPLRAWWAYPLGCLPRQPGAGVRHSPSSQAARPARPALWRC